MNMTTRRILTGMMSAILTAASAVADTVPARLPQPDGKPADMSKPVKVYILAGQSNMVGFGTLKGARPVYPSIFLSADPGVKPGRMPVGPSALLPHGVYRSADGDKTGAKVAIYAGSYQADANYAKMKPIKETRVDLGMVKADLPSVNAPHTVVAEAYIDVPMTGSYEVHVGFEESTHAVAELDGEEVYRKSPGNAATIAKVDLERGKRYPLTITYMSDGSAALWLKRVDLEGKGDLTTLTGKGSYRWFIDNEDEWTVRKDATYWDVRLSKEELGSGGPLSTTSNGRFMGPEVPFGYVMAAYHDAHVLLIESSMGNRALSFDFRPPSSPKTDKEKKNKYCGLEYDLMVEGVHRTLKNLDKVIPGYQGQGYEIEGFVWWQGHKDKGVPKNVYEKHLVNLIQDVRKEFTAPEMKVAVATVGFGGMDMAPGHFMTWEAQMAVADPKQHPEFVGNVDTVDTRGFWRSRGESPTGTGYHYNHNAETYVLTGDALGRAMVELLGGEAETLEPPPKPERDPNAELIFSDAVTGNYNKRGPHYPPEYYREMGQALKPIILEEMIPAFLADRRSGSAIKGIALGKRPSRTSLDIRGPFDALIEYYDIAGLSEYGWNTFAPQLKGATWNYYSFDPPEQQPAEQSDRYREITFPEGMENWYAADFDPAAAGWKKGEAPFGRMGDKLEARRPSCNGTHCGCSKAPKTFWEHEVLLMRKTFDVPPIKEGHAYRLILGGAGCDRSGEGFAIYVNGKQLTQVDGGFYRYKGIRGAYIYEDILPEFKGGEVTIAIINFLRYTHFRNKTTYFGPHPDYYAKPVPPNGHVDVWMEEAKLSPAVLDAADGVE